MHDAAGSGGRPPRVAWFVSPHGFGHAARSAAVIEALVRLAPGTAVGVFTTVPKWFFTDSLSAEVAHHPVSADVGLVQTTALVEDVAATIDRLRTLFPPPAALIQRLASVLAEGGYDLVVSDIAPLGLIVAEHLCLPSVLVENFTWDWIYRAYRDQWPEIGVVADLMALAFDTAGLHISAVPFCRRCEGAVEVAPISREPRRRRCRVRRDLGLEDDRRVVLLTMGGIEFDYRFLDRLGSEPDTIFVVPGGGAREKRRGNVVRLPHHSRFYHPDLVHAADLVVGKIGYSTLAEVYDAGVAYAFVERERFPESSILAAFAEANLASCSLRERDFVTGDWIDRAFRLFEGARCPRGRATGASEAARLILEYWTDRGRNGA